MEGTNIPDDAVKKLHIPYCFSGNPYVGMQANAIDGDHSSRVFTSLFAYFPLLHSHLKRSGINIICKSTHKMDIFRKTLAENYTSQKQALVEEHPEFLNATNNYCTRMDE